MQVAHLQNDIKGFGIYYGDLKIFEHFFECTCKYFSSNIAFISEIKNVNVGFFLETPLQLSPSKNST